MFVILYNNNIFNISNLNRDSYCGDCFDNLILIPSKNMEKENNVMELSIIFVNGHTASRELFNFNFQAQFQEFQF